MKDFLDKDFLLESDAAKLFHEYAENADLRLPLPFKSEGNL